VVSAYPYGKRVEFYVCMNVWYVFKELDGLAFRALRREIAKVKQLWLVIGWATKIYYLEFLRASEGTLSHFSMLHLHPPTRNGLEWWVMARSPYV
jgi:hypothetical protein